MSHVILRGNLKSPYGSKYKGEEEDLEGLRGGAKQIIFVGQELL